MVDDFGRRPDRFATEIAHGDRLDDLTVTASQLEIAVYDPRGALWQTVRMAVEECTARWFVPLAGSLRHFVGAAGRGPQM